MKISLATRLSCLCLIFVCVFFSAGSAIACNIAGADGVGGQVVAFATPDAPLPPDARGNGCCSGDEMLCVSCGVLAKLPHSEGLTAYKSDIIYPSAFIADFSGLDTPPEPRPPRWQV